MPSRCRIALLASLAILASVAASAEIYTVALKNGNSFESRYPPRAASYDLQKILVLTEWGNWMAIERAEVSEITTQTATKGYGTVIDTTTISLGLAANDRSEDGEGGPRVNGGGPASDKPYNIDQFVEPDHTQGIPGSFSGGSTSRVEVVAPSPPPAAAPSGGGGGGSGT